MSFNRDLPIEAARLRIDQLTGQTNALDVDRIARLTAKTCTRDELATLLADCLKAQDAAQAALQQASVQVFAVQRALELLSYREPRKTAP